MPGWYIHMDTARKALSRLSSNAGASSIFGAEGPDANELTGIATRNPAYVALGAIGPDIFFLLPDFKPPFGSLLWGAANTIKDLYTWWDDNFLGPYEDQLGPIAMNAADELGALTGGLSDQLSRIFSRAFKFLLDTVLVMIIRQYDVFSLLGSGVPAGYDEQTFYWSDMLHYRKTYEFAAHLWQKANNENNERLKAFALGWMSHLATDVAGHCFVNEKCGGPYRLHWQRHHLIENHMDARVYDSEHGSGSIYQMLSCAALHLWIAFNPDGSSRVNFFQSQPGPSYATGDSTPDILDRKRKWDVDSDIPAGLAQFLAEALKEVYNDEFTGTQRPQGQRAAHPTILKDLEPAEDGYVNKDNIATTYWWLYHYAKFTTTDYFELLRPKPPDVINIPPFPSPPGSGTSDPGPGSSDDSAWHDFLDILLAIFAWIFYLAEVAAWPAAAIVSLITSAGTYPIRELLYENLELPLYNAWLALHWYLTMTGFVYPMQQEINAGLTTLGIGVGDTWTHVQSALNDLSGGLINPPPAGGEPSGRDLDRETPHDAVLDPPDSSLQALGALFPGCHAGEETPSEFRRPWLWPAKDNQGDPVPSEFSLAPASPYHSTQNATVLMTSSPGDNPTRSDFEHAKNEQDTIKIASSHLPQGKHLGDPVDYTSYVVAQLTRKQPGTIANFNLDADRGYGYLCWDWVRTAFVAAPGAYKNGATPEERHEYRAPQQPGYGWCDDDILRTGPPPNPVRHTQTADPGSTPVMIRYIDREDK